MQVFI